MIYHKLTTKYLCSRVLNARFKTAPTYFDAAAVSRQMMSSPLRNGEKYTAAAFAFMFSWMGFPRDTNRAAFLVIGSAVCTPL